jgi:hypothetical protein
LKITNKRIDELIRESIQRHVNEEFNPFVGGGFSGNTSKLNIVAHGGRLATNDIHPDGVYSLSMFKSKKARSNEGKSDKGEAAGLVQLSNLTNAIISSTGLFYVRLKDDAIRKFGGDRTAYLDKSASAAGTLIDPNAVYWIEDKAGTTPAVFARVRGGGKRSKIPLVLMHPNADPELKALATKPYHKQQIQTGDNPSVSVAMGGQLGAAAQELIATWITNELGKRGAKNSVGNILSSADIASGYPTTAGVGSTDVDIQIAYSSDVTLGSDTHLAGVIIEFEIKSNSFAHVNNEDHLYIIVHPDMKTCLIFGRHQDAVRDEAPIDKIFQNAFPGLSPMNDSMKSKQYGKAKLNNQLSSAFHGGVEVSIDPSYATGNVMSDASKFALADDDKSQDKNRKYFADYAKTASLIGANNKPLQGASEIEDYVKILLSTYSGTLCNWSYDINEFGITVPGIGSVKSGQRDWLCDTYISGWPTMIQNLKNYLTAACEEHSIDTAGNVTSKKPRPVTSAPGRNLTGSARQKLLQLFNEKCKDIGKKTKEAVLDVLPDNVKVGDTLKGSTITAMDADYEDGQQVIIVATADDAMHIYSAADRTYKETLNENRSIQVTRQQLRRLLRSIL